MEMLRRLSQRHAFTLIELLVVILIVAILIAVALPAFLGQTAKAQDSVVQQRLAVTRTEAKAFWTANGQSGYPSTGALVSALRAAEPSYSFTPDSGQSATQTSIGVSVSSSDANIATFCQQSQSGTFFCLRVDEAGGLYALSASSASAPAADVLSPQAASAATAYTDVLYTEGPTESGAICVLNAGTPSAGQNGPGSYSGCDGQAGWSTAPTATVTQVAPTFTAQPSIAGSAVVGSDLTASPGSYTGTPIPAISAYQWQDCPDATGTGCTNIAGANSSAYAPQASDVNQTLRVAVTVTNSAGSATAYSPTTAAVAEPYDQLVAADGAADYFKLNEPAGAGQAADSIQPSNSSTSISGVTFGSAGYGSGMTAANITNTSASPAINTPPLQPASTAFTEEAWIKTTHSTGAIFTSRDSTDVDANSLTLGLGIVNCPAGTLDFGVNSNDTWVGVCSTQTVDTGSWVYVTGVFSSTSGTLASPSQFSVYINGVKASTTAADINYCANSSSYHGPSAPFGGSTGTAVDGSNNCSVTSGANFITHGDIGGNSDAGYYNGLLERLAIYDKALTATQISHHYADGSN